MIYRKGFLIQTFLPYESYANSARVLDGKRLNKQKVECLQILNVLLGIGKRNKNGKLAWENHPAVRQWKNYEGQFFGYAMVITEECINRGYKDTCKEKFLHLRSQISEHSYSKPFWLGSSSYHAAMRSNLLRKNPEWYSQFGWTERHDLPYIWPV